MELPVYIGAQVRGRLRRYSQGLYQVFEAEINTGDCLRRLWLQGAQTNFSLGIMKPAGERAVLYKKLTKLQAKEIPEKILRVQALSLGEQPEKAEISEPGSPEIRAPEEKARPQYWKELPDGCLSGIIKQQHYLAFPAYLPENIRGIRRIRYKKREYIVFRY